MYFCVLYLNIPLFLGGKRFLGRVAYLARTLHQALLQTGRGGHGNWDGRAMAGKSPWNGTLWSSEMVI